MEQLKTDKF